MNSLLIKQKLAIARCGAITLVGLFMAGSAFSQEFRGSITGRVLDQNGSGVPGAQVAVTNAQTNVTSTTITEPGGEYTVLYLIPGPYRITVTMAGFKTLVRDGIEVRVGDKLGLDLQLEVGTVQETVNVSSEGPLLETTNASSGQVIDRRRITELPLLDGNPTMLTRIAVGVTATGSFGQFNQAFSNFGPSSIRVDGAPGENEYTINGFPNMSIARKVAFNIPADAVTEFKMQNASYDAQTGHTGAAVINNSLSSGTNELHGTLYGFIRNDALNVNEFFRNRAGLPKAPLRYARYGGSVSGPVRVPKLYNGRDKTFFFFNYEHLYDNFPETNTFSVPTDAERNGDFTDLLPGSKIYDPFMGSSSGGIVTRKQICIRDTSGNCKPGTLNMIDPARISPIARAYLQFIPHPNLPGTTNNFVGSPPNLDRFNSYAVRIDHNFREKQTISFHYLRNGVHQLRGGWTDEFNGVQPSGQEFFRNNNVIGFDHVITFSSTTVLDTRVGYSRFLELSLPRSLNKFDPATMGFSAQTVALFEGYQYVPKLTINQYLPPTSFFDGALGKDVGGPSAFNIYVAQPTLTKIAGRHTLRIGYDFRAYRQNQSAPGNIAGWYQFQADFTKQSSTSGTQFGQSLASFLLGLPTGGGFIDRNVAGGSYQSLYHGIFFQDDWKVSPRLTVNLGLRFEYEPPTTERFNRNIRGFDTTSSNPIEAAAVAAYAKNPDVLSPADFHVRGGFLFADSNHRGIWQSGPGNFEPRLGIAYRLGAKTVVRAGYAILAIPFLADGTNGGSTFVINQTGFSLQTFVIPTNDNGLTFNPSNCTFNCWANPFPNGAATPPGSSQGLATFLGQSISTVIPLDRRNGLVQHFSADIQRELLGGWVVDVGYFGTRGSRLNTTQAIDPIPRQYLSTQPIRDQGVIDFLGALVANPFAGLLPRTGLNGAKIARSQLLRPFPQFTGINILAHDGRTSYDSLQVRIEKRFSRGFTLEGGYTWSKLIEQLTRLNETDPQYEKRISPDDVTHRVVLSGIWELPFGRGRRWGSHWNKVLDAVAGGWQVGPSFQAQSGRPITLGNIVFFGDLSTLRTNISSGTIDQAFDTSGFYFTDAPVQTNGVPDPAKQRADSRIRLANNIRTLPSTLSWFRAHGQNNWDLALIKKFSISEHTKLQFRTEVFDLFNRVHFNGPNVDPTSSGFGKITSQANTPGRFLQFGLKLTF